MLVCVASTRSSPGATTLSVALAQAWQIAGYPTTLIEADPAGGVLALRFGLTERPSLATMSSDTRRSRTLDDVLRNAQDINGVNVIAGPADPLVAARAVQSSTATIIELAKTPDSRWVCDLGRIDERSAAIELAKAADQTILVSRTAPAEVQALLYAARLLRSHNANLGLVTVGDRPHAPAEVQSIAEIELLAALPDAPTVAPAFNGGHFKRSQLRRSTLWRSVIGLAKALDPESQEPQPGELAPPPAQSNPAATEATIESAPPPAPLTPPSPPSAPAPPAQPPAPPAPLAEDIDDLFVWTPNTDRIDD